LAAAKHHSYKKKKPPRLCRSGFFLVAFNAMVELSSMVAFNAMEYIYNKARTDLERTP